MVSQSPSSFSFIPSPSFARRRCVPSIRLFTVFINLTFASGFRHADEEDQQRFSERRVRVCVYVHIGTAIASHAIAHTCVICSRNIVILINSICCRQFIKFNHKCHYYLQPQYDVIIYLVLLLQSPGVTFAVSLLCIDAINWDSNVVRFVIARRCMYMQFVINAIACTIGTDKWRTARKCNRLNKCTAQTKISLLLKTCWSLLSLAPPSDYRLKQFHSTFLCFGFKLDSFRPICLALTSAHSSLSYSKIS